MSPPKGIRNFVTVKSKRSKKPRPKSVTSCQGPKESEQQKPKSKQTVVTMAAALRRLSLKCSEKKAVHISCMLMLLVRAASRSST